jgi:hypothetical protein
VIPDLHFDRGFLSFAGINVDGRGTQAFFSNARPGNSLSFGVLDGGGSGETVVGFLSDESLHVLGKVCFNHRIAACVDKYCVDLYRIW